MSTKADEFYSASAAKPKPTAVDADGWRQLPGGGWVKDRAETNGYSGLVFTGGGAKRAADIFYGTEK